MLCMRFVPSRGQKPCHEASRLDLHARNEGEKEEEKKKEEDEVKYDEEKISVTGYVRLAFPS